MRQLIARELRRAHRSIQPGNVSLVIATSGTAAALAEASAPRHQVGGISDKSQRTQRSVGTNWRTVSAGTAGFAPAQLVRKLATKMPKMSAAGARGHARHRAAAGRDHRRRRRGLCRTAG